MMKYKYQVLYVFFILLFALFVNARQFRIRPVPVESVKPGIDSTAVILNFARQNASEDCVKLINAPQQDFLTFMRDSLSAFQIPNNKKVIILDSYELRLRFMAYFFYVKYGIVPEIVLCNIHEK